MPANIIENPFGVMDVPAPYDSEVMEFAQNTALDGASNDRNAVAWASTHIAPSTIEGHWESRWNGAADPTVPGDAADKWKQGVGEVKVANDRVYLRLEWRRSHGPDRGGARRRKQAGWEVHQPEQPGNHTPLDRFDRKQRSHRWPLP